MAKPEAVFLYIGTYANKDLAQLDYDIVKDLHWADAVGGYDAAVIVKDEHGKVHVNKDETSTRHGAWGGVAVGALVGILFPPSLIGSAAVGAAVGGVGGHLRNGLSRSEVKELGDFIDAGEACLLVIAEAKGKAVLDGADLSAQRYVERQLDVDSKDLDAAVKSAAKDLN